MASEDVALPHLDLRFVDHVESKIQSPEKEVLSPTKASVEGSDVPLLPPLINGTDIDKKCTDSSLNDKVKVDEKDAKSHDSGLDSSNSSSGTGEEHFIDRQESYTSVGEPEVLTSPNKTVDKLFNFLDNESSQSLDALNNNSEVVLEEGSTGDESGNSPTKDVYLGKEVDLHENKENEDRKAQRRDTNDASMNLYWYTSNLDVDVSELEAFKTAQAENGLAANVTSNLEVTVGNGYYKTKNVDVELEPASQNSFTSETKFDVKTEPLNRDSWSPAFESASSRILDLASELKSEPKDKKNRENETIKDTIDPNEEKHPWGLDLENKVRTEMSKEVHDDLPDIEVLHYSENDEQVKELENRTDEIGAKRNEGEDVTDAVGYMEFNSKPIEQTLVSTISVESNKAIEAISEDALNSKISESNLGEMNEESYSEDVADAIGYMEWKDKPVEVVVTASEQAVLETSKTEGTVTNDTYKSEITTSLEDQILQSNMPEAALKNSKHVEKSEDIADAVGYMELKDKPTEQTFTSIDQSVLEGSEQEVGDAGCIKEASVANLECQIIGKKVKKEFALESENKVDTKLEGIDIVDARLEGNEKVEKVEAFKIHSPPQTVEAQERVQTKLFEPFNIKRKYQITGTSEEILQAMGGMFLETETLVDEYLDDKNYSLTLSDCWLRLRNKKFEMKINAAFGIGPNKSPSVEIITNESDIQEMLMKKYARKLEQKRRVSERQLDVLIDALDISLFVTFETTRKRYQMDGFIVTLDVTNFGFQVGEIEVVAKSLPEMMTSLVKIDDLAGKLGFRPLQNS